MAELTPEQQKELNELSAALRSEFAESQASAASKSAKKDIEELKPEMLDALEHILKHSADQSLRARVAMWGYDKLLAEGKAGTDPIRDLIAGMPAPKVKTDEDEPSAEAEEKAVDIPLEVMEDE